MEFTINAENHTHFIMTKSPVFDDSYELKA